MYSVWSIISYKTANKKSKFDTLLSYATQNLDAPRKPIREVTTIH